MLTRWILLFLCEEEKNCEFMKIPSQHPNPGLEISRISDLDFSKIIQDSPIAFYATDAEGRIVFFNQAAEKLWGRSPDLDIDLWCGAWRIYSPDGRPVDKAKCPMALTLKRGVALPNQRVSIERPDGSFRELMVFPQPIFDSHGDLQGAHNTLIDVTEQKNNEIKRATLSSIVESSEDAIISKNLDGIITSWNAGAERILKYTEEEVLGKSIQMLIPESRRDDEDIIMETVKKGERVDHFETVRLDKFGHEIPLSLTISPVKDSRGRIIGASKVARDISDRLQGEEKDAILSAIVQSSDDAIISKDLNGNIMSWNRGAEQIFGYTEKEVLGKHITILIPEERLAEEEHIISKIRKGEKVDHFETFRKAQNGVIFPISLTVSPIKDRQGNIVGASKIARDISEQVQTQQELKKYMRHLEILNSLGKSISKKMNVKQILQQVTDATTSLTGAAMGAFFYNSVTEEGGSYQLFTLSGADRKDFEKFGMPGNSAVFHPTFSGEGILRVDDITQNPRYGRNDPHYGIPKGHPPVRSFLTVPVFSGSGEVIGGLFYGHPEAGVFTKEHEDLVISIASQAAISLDNSMLFEQVKNLSDKKDEFIAVASHELKTPLTTIKGYLQVLARKETDSMSSHFIDKSLNQVNKLNTLVEDLLNMSRIEAGKLDFHWEIFDLRQLLGEMSETFGYSNKTHKLHCVLGDKPVLISGDKQRIEQVVINLLNNAVKYSPKADKVYLKLSQDSGYARITVKDEGIGLSPKEKNQIFSRYFRAKSAEGISGLGVGLYITNQIVDRHEGRIEVESTLGKGSEFQIILPLKNVTQK